MHVNIVRKTDFTCCDRHVEGKRLKESKAAMVGFLWILMVADKQ